MPRILFLLLFFIALGNCCRSFAQDTLYAKDFLTLKLAVDSANVIGHGIVLELDDSSYCYRDCINSHDFVITSHIKFAAKYGHRAKLYFELRPGADIPKFAFAVDGCYAEFENIDFICGQQSDIDAFSGMLITNEGAAELYTCSFYGYADQWQYCIAIDEHCDITAHECDMDSWDEDIHYN